MDDNHICHSCFFWWRNSQLGEFPFRKFENFVIIGVLFVGFQTSEIRHI